MTDIGVFSPKDARTVLDTIRWLKASGMVTQTGFKMPGNFSPKTPAYAKNVSGETIPAYACVQCVGTIELGGQNYIEIDQPVDDDGTAGQFLFNGHNEIQPDEFGKLDDSVEVRALFSDPSAGARMNPTAGSWDLSAADDGMFSAIGPDDIGPGVCRVVRVGQCCSEFDDPCRVEMMVDFRKWENAVDGNGQVYSFTAEKIEWYTDTEEPETVENFDYIIHTNITPLDDADIFVRRIDKFHGSPTSSKYMPQWYHSGAPGRVTVFTTFIDSVIVAGQSNVELIADATLQERAQDAMDIVSNARDTLIDAVAVMNDFITNMAISRNYISANYISGDRLRGVFSATLETFVDDYIAAANSFLANWNVIENSLEFIRGQSPVNFASVAESTVASAVSALEANANQVHNGVNDGVLDKAETLRDMWTVNDVKDMFDSLSKVEHDWGGLEIIDDYSSLKAYPHRALPQGWVDFGIPARTLQEWETKIRHNSYATQWVTDDDPETYQAQLWDYNPPVFASEHVRHLKHNDVSGNGWHFYDNRGITEFKTLTVGCDVFPKWSSSDFGVPRLYQFDSWSTHSYPTEPAAAKIKPSITIKMPTSQFKYTIDCYRSRCVSSPIHQCADTLRRYKIINATYVYEQTPDLWLLENDVNATGEFPGDLVGECCAITAANANNGFSYERLSSFNGTVTGIVGPFSNPAGPDDPAFGPLYNYATFPLDEHLPYITLYGLQVTYPRDQQSITGNFWTNSTNQQDCPFSEDIDETSLFADDKQELITRPSPGHWLVGDLPVAKGPIGALIYGPFGNPENETEVEIIHKGELELPIEVASYPIIQCISVFDGSYGAMQSLWIGRTITQTVDGFFSSNTIDEDRPAGAAVICTQSVERTLDVPSSSLLGDITIEWEADNAPL